MTVRIVTDSACDISLDEAAQLNVKIVPLSIRFGEEEFTDLADITVTEFYEKWKQATCYLLQLLHLLALLKTHSANAMRKALQGSGLY